MKYIPKEVIEFIRKRNEEKELGLTEKGIMRLAEIYDDLAEDYFLYYLDDGIDYETFDIAYDKFQKLLEKEQKQKSYRARMDEYHASCRELIDAYASFNSSNPDLYASMIDYESPSYGYGFGRSREFIPGEDN